MTVLTELKNRGVQDIFIACVDGLTGFPEAIAATFPNTLVQLCMVHMVRNSAAYVSYKDRKAVCADLKAMRWDSQYPTISKSWRAHWVNVIPIAFPSEIRKVMYSTNAIESENMCLCKVTKNHLIFPTDEAALEVIYLAIGNLSKKWTMPIRDWKPALNRFAIEFEGRMPRERSP